MKAYHLGSLAAALVCMTTTLAGCGRQPDSDAHSAVQGQNSFGEQSSPTAAVSGSLAEPNVIVGRVTMADGQPLRGDIKDVSISIYGVSDVDGKVRYSPAVKADGTYRQKVIPGQYRFERSLITVGYNSVDFQFPLEPVGRLWNKDQDAADGIVQDFIWKVSGATPYGQASGLDPGNATHWYGMSIGLRADGWRQDLNQAPNKIPDGTKLTFKLKPTSKSIDGRELEPIAVQREFSLSNLDINDIVPADYELSGVALLPDGKEQPLLLQGPGDYPSYKPTVKLTVQLDNIIGGMWKPPCTFILP